MKIIDTHCDALLKLQMKQKKASLDQDDSLDTSIDKLKQGNIMIQFYAIFIQPELSSDQKWQSALEQVDLFYRHVLGKNSEMKHIKNWQQIQQLQEGEIGAVLTLEGADIIGNSPVKLRHLYRLGVLSLGLTWNYANLCADGVGEPRGGGLTLFGKEVVALNNEYHVFTDVSHLSVAGFWDVMEIANFPIASHSNARTICEHPRNLYDGQAKALFAKKGLIHVVFYPPFINEGRETATITDVIKHIDHLCALGGEKQIGFGSDFDGINLFVTDLENASKYSNLINELLKHYSEEQVKGFAYQNLLAHLPKSCNR